MKEIDPKHESPYSLTQDLFEQIGRNLLDSLLKLSKKLDQTESSIGEIRLRTEEVLNLMLRAESYDDRLGKIRSRWDDSNGNQEN